MKPVNKKIMKLAKLGIWVLLVSGLVISLAFVGAEQSSRMCKNVDVSIEPEIGNFFVDRKMVIGIISDNKGIETVQNLPVAALNISDLEKELELNPYIEDADVFLTIGGDLKINVLQRKPVVRVFNNLGRSYYIDHKGLKMPVSDRFTARVMIATGFITERLEQKDSLSTSTTKEIFAVADFVDKNNFWKAQIEQIFVDSNDDLILIPKVGSHKIIFGPGVDVEEKFRKLMIFYKDGLTKVGWNKYKSINLKFKDQVVCEK